MQAHRCVILLFVTCGFALSSAHAKDSRSIPWLSACQEKNAEGFPVLKRSSRECHTDRFGRRVVHQRRHGKKSPFLAFFGGAVALGPGVADWQTLPARVSKLCPKCAVYDYGDIHYGPNNVLQLWQTRDFRKEIPQTRGEFVYLWRTQDARRVLGSLSLPYTDTFPRYGFDSHHHLELKGTFRASQPWRYRLFDFLRRWNLGQKLGFDIPPHVTNENYRTIARIFTVIQRISRDEFPNSDFYLVLYPEKSPGALRASVAFTKIFYGSAVHVIDWTGLPMLKHDGKDLLPDGNPSARTYRALAAGLQANCPL